MVVADDRLRDLLASLNARLCGRVAIVSGRSLFQIDAILGPVAKEIAVSGSHGAEHRWKNMIAQPRRPIGLDRAEQELRAFADAHEGLLFEQKSFGAALHYRLCPGMAEKALEVAADTARRHNLLLQRGKMLVELRVAGGTKGSAVRRLMRLQPMHGSVPIFVGDDCTDEDGFIVANELGGAGVLVGEPRQTAARFRLRDPDAVHAWLQGMVQ